MIPIKPSALESEWVKKMWYILLLLGHKKNEITPFVATWTDLEMIMLCEVSQRKTDMISLIRGI